jgi:hypothetical protein
MWSFDPVSGLRWFILIVTGAAFSALLGMNRGRWAIALLAISYTLLVGLAVVYAYAYPQPLQKALLKLEDGSYVRGDYVTRNGSTWYIRSSATPVVLAIDSTRVVQATLIPRGRHEPRSLSKIVRSWLP